MSDDILLGLVVAVVCALTALAFQPALARLRAGPPVKGGHGAAAAWGVGVADSTRTGADPPVVHDVPRDVAECVIPGFRPGVDTCRIFLNDPDAEFDAVVTAAAARLVFLDDGSLLEVVFPDVPTPPLADTFVVGPDGGARLLAERAATLPPADCDAPLRSGRSEVPAFQAFDALSELVEIWVPEDRPMPPDVIVRPTSDNRDGELLIDGRPAARLCNAPDASALNVRVLRKSMVRGYSGLGARPPVSWGHDVNGTS